MQTYTRLSSLTLIAVMLLLSGCGYVAVVKVSETRTQETAHVAGTQLVVNNVNGTIDIIGEPDRDAVQVTAEITAGGLTAEAARQRLSETVLNISRDTNRVLTISADFPEPATTGDQANLTVRVPGAADVKVTSVNGTVTVKSISATMTLNTTNGSVNVIDGNGDAGITTVNGRVSLERHAGVVTARTTNGRITLTELDGSADVNTVNGRVTISMADSAAGPLQVRTTNGRIEATLGAGFAGEMDASTSNGSITVDDEAGIVQAQVSDRRSSKVSFVKEGVKSTLRTSNGRITVKTTLDA